MGWMWHWTPVAEKCEKVLASCPIFTNSTILNMGDLLDYEKLALVERQAIFYG
jgi:hypothetical protein